MVAPSGIALAPPAHSLAEARTRTRIQPDWRRQCAGKSGRHRIEVAVSLRPTHNMTTLKVTGLRDRRVIAIPRNLALLRARVERLLPTCTNDKRDRLAYRHQLPVLERHHKEVQANTDGCAAGRHLPVSIDDSMPIGPVCCIS